MNDMSSSRGPRPLPSTAVSEDMTLVRSIPIQFPQPDLRSRGNLPVAVYEYRNADASLACMIARYESPTGKQLFPATVWRDGAGEMCWYSKGLPDERPLYRLTELLSHPELPVLISEGEKCADAAASFQGFSSVSWMGGSNTLKKTDFAPLAGRDVIILPDNDGAGTKAAEELAQILSEIDAARIRVLDIARLADDMGASGVEGFDIADAVGAGLSEQQFVAKLDIPGTLTDMRIRPILPDDPVYHEVWDRFGLIPEVPQVFELTENGIIKTEIDGKENIVQVYAGSPLVVLGRTRAAFARGGWGYLVAFRTPTGEWDTLTIRAELLAGDGKEMRECLAEAGFIVPQQLAGRRALAEYIGYAQQCQIIEVTSRVGWNGNAFAHPAGMILPHSSDRNVILDLGGRAHYLRSAGTLEKWQELVSLAEPNSRATFALCVALAAPLLRPLNMPGGGFHFWGQSSRGKTILLKVAGSVWGGGGNDGFVRNWRMTDNGAEGLIADHNDILLPLDELTLVAPETAAELYYLLANGHGKARAKKDGLAADSRQWKALVLSSGENTSAHQIDKGRGKTRMTGGLAVRMVDVPIEIEPGLSFETHAPFNRPGELADRMSSIAKNHYGHAGRAFVSEIVRDYDRVIARAREIVDDIVSSLTADPADDPQVRRVAERFALAGAAGILAAAQGILPMQSSSIYRATTTCFEAWRAHRGGGKSEEELNGLRQLKHFFETDGAARFERIIRTDPEGAGAQSGDFVVRDRCGYREQTDDGAWIYYVLPEAWRREVCGDHAPDLMVKLARDAGALTPGEGRHCQKKVKLPDYPSFTRVYVLRPDLLP